jgi:3',5'-nucleoside bisphosphate phosphatase
MNSLLGRSSGPEPRVDLHIHTHVSDGHFSPGQIVEAALAANLEVIAITDHDTAGGVDQALAAAAGTPLRVVPGIEISTRWGSSEYHVLGYWIDHHSPSILLHQEASVLRRIERMRRMVARLQEMGVGITYEAVERAAGPAAMSIGRPHLARALFEAGFTRYYGEAFEKYISDSGPAFVEQAFPSPEDAIAVIHMAGGLAVWAHPPAVSFDAEIESFVRWGIDGIECFRPNHTPAESSALEARVRRLGLFPTGGSDWHGPHRAILGEFSLRASQVTELLNWRSDPPAPPSRPG